MNQNYFSIHPFQKSTLKKLVGFIAFVLIFLNASTAEAQGFRSPSFSGNSFDFNFAERVAASDNVDYYVTYDQYYMYFGAFRTNGTSWGANDHFTIYFDADPRSSPSGAGNGSTVGVNWDSNTPNLPFRADYRVAARTNGGFGSGTVGSSFYSSNNTTSGTANWTTGSANAKGYTQFVSNIPNGGIEIRIPMSDLGNPSSIYYNMFATYNTANSGFFGSAIGNITANSGGVFTVSNYFGSIPVYKTGTNLISTTNTPISNLTVTSNTTTSGDYGDISVTGANIVWTLAGSSSFTGTMTVGASNSSRVNLVSSSNSLYIGGRGVGGSAGQIAINSSSGNPIYSGTSSGGNVIFMGNGLVNGTGTRMFGNSSNAVNIAIAGAVDFTGGSGTTTLFNGGSLAIYPGGSVTNPLTYQTGSTLIYATGGTYTASNEWTAAATSGAGYPDRVTIQGNTNLSFGSSGSFRQCSGNFNINSGSTFTLSSAAGGDFRFAGGASSSFTNAGTFNTNGRAFMWNGTGSTTYSKTGGGTDTIDIFIHNSTSQFGLAASPNATNLTLVSTGTTAASCLQMQSSGNLYLDANTLTIPNNGTIYVTGASSNIQGAAAGTPGILSFAGIGNITPVTSGTSTVTCSAATRVQTSSQLKVGGTSGTPALSIAGVLRLNQGGYVDNAFQPIKYNSGSTLEYNHTTGTYGVQATEFPATNGPTNLTVNANGGTGISFATNNITARTLAGTLTLNHNLVLSGSGPAALTTLNTIANATATVSGTGNFSHSASGSFTTANLSGVNGTITASGTVTLPTTTSFAFNGTASQVTGTMLPTTVAALTINNTASGTGGVTITNSALTITGVTTLTKGALILPTAGGNLVTFTGAISTPTSGGTITGSTTSNITTGGSVSGTGAGIAFTTGGQNLGNWTCNAVFGAATPTGLNSPLAINGTFSFPSSSPDLFTTASGSITFVSGSTFTQNGTSGARILGSGTCTVNSGANMFIGSTTGLASTGANGVIQTATRSFSGGANYTFNNSTATQAIGDALDGTSGTGKTGAITGNVVINNSFSTGVTLNAGTTITVNSPGVFAVGVNNTSSGILTIPATSFVNGTGQFMMYGNGATNGSTLSIAHASGINGAITTSGTNNLSNGSNNNTNFIFNGTAQQVTGSLMPSTINNFTSSNTFTSITSAPITDAGLTFSGSTTINGTTTFNGVSPIGIVGIGAGNTLAINGILTLGNANKLIGTSTSNLSVGGSGTFSGSGLMATGGTTLNDFTINRTGVTVFGGASITVLGTFNLTNGLLNQSASLTLSGAINLGASGQLRHTGGGLTVNGSGTITGTLATSATPLSLTSLTMNRSGQTLTLATNVTISGGTTPLTLSGGIVDLAGFNLTLSSTNNLTITPTNGGMLKATGAGLFIKNIPTGASSFNMPIGDGTNYTPVTFSFTANAVAGTVGGKVTASAHPQNTLTAQTNFLSRYWSFTTASLTTYTYSSTFTYVSGDINGTESLIKLNRYNGTAWSEYATSSASSNVLTSPTGLTETTGLLNGNDFAGRVEAPPVSYTWVGGTSTDWATAANWNPSGVPSSIDTVTIDTTPSNPCTIVSGSKTVANIVLNSTGTLVMQASTSLTVTGSVTYGGTATATLDCSSTINFSNTSSVTVPPLNYGNLNLTGGNRVLNSTGTIGICGTFTTGAGTYTTTGSTVDFNGSTSQTIPALLYNHLTSSSTGARTLASSGTIGVAGTFTPGTNAYTSTGSTIDFNGTGTQTVPAFASYNNLTISGARGTATITLASGTIGVGGTFNPSATGAITYSTTGNTFDYTSASAQTIVGFNKYNNLSNSGNGARTLSSAANIVIDGVYTPTSGAVTIGTSTIDFSSASSQTMPATFYYNVTNSGNGTRTWANTGIIDINAGFAPTTATNTITGSTLRYSSTAASTTFNMSSFTTNVANTQYNNLIFGGASTTGWALASGFNLGVAGDLSITGSGTFYVSNNTTPNTNTATVGGNVSVSSGTIIVSNSTGTGSLNVTGGVTMTGGTINVVTATTGNGSATIGGNLSVSTGTFNVSNSAGTGSLTVTGSTSITSGLMNVANSTGPGTFGVTGDLNVTGTGKIYASNAAGAGTINVTGNVSCSSTTTNAIVVSGSTGQGDLNITGNLNLSTATGTAVTLAVTFSASHALTTDVSVGGNVTLSGLSKISLEPSANTSGVGTMTIAGDFTATSTSTTMVDFGAGANLAGNQIAIAGNFTKSGTGSFTTSGSGSTTNSNGFVFTKNGTQNFDYSGATSQYTSYLVNASSTLKFVNNGLTLSTLTNPRSNFTVNGTLDVSTFVLTAANGTDPIFTLASGATLKTANTGGLASSLSGFTTGTTALFNAAANYEFNGAASQTTTFPGATMNNLTINNSAGVKLNTVGITINGTLGFTAGNFDLNGSNNVTLGTSATISGESNTTRIVNTGTPTAANGFIGTTRTLGSNPGNVANLGMNISTASAMGSTVLKRFPKAVSSIPTSLNSISRVYSITPTTASASSTVSFNYFDNELNGNTESAPSLILYTSNGTNETVAANYSYSGITSFDATANTITQSGINLTNALRFWTALNTDQYITAQSGDWSTASTWVPGSVPPNGVTATVIHATTVNSSVATTPATITLSTGGSLSFGTSGSLTTTTFNNGGTGVSMTGSGVLNIATSGTFANGSSNTIGGLVNFNGTGTVTGTASFNNVSLSGGVNFGAASTVTGNMTINSGGFVSTNAPTYDSSSTLIYNTGGTYGRSAEWSTTTGAGYPNNVTIQGNTNLNVVNGSNSYKKLGGNLTVNSGSTFTVSGLTSGTGGVGVEAVGSITNDGTITLNSATNQRLKSVNLTNGSVNTGAIVNLSSTSGGDLELTGNYTDNAVFNANTRAVFFTGTGVQTIGGGASAPFNIDYIVLAKASGRVQLLTDLLTAAPNTGNAVTLTSSTDVLDLNGYTMTLGTAGQASGITGSGSFRGGSTSGMIINGTGSFGTINFDQTSSSTRLLDSLTINRTSSGNVQLGSALTVNTSLALTAGTLTLGSNHLTIGASGTISGSFSSSNMIVATGSGELRKTFTGTGSFTYPVGDATSTAEYSPVTLNFTSGSFSSAYAGVKVTNSKQTNNSSATDFINRYWTLTSNGITSPVYTVTATYTDADIAGTEANLYCGLYDGASWNCLSNVTTSTNAISGTLSVFGDLTAGEQIPVGCCINPTSGGVIAAAQTVCSGSAPSAFTSSSLPTGHNGTLQYQWQISTTSSSAGFADISGETSSTLTYSTSLTQNTWFKRLSRVSCKTDWTGAVSSNVVQVTVNPTSVSGSITGATSVCTGTNSTTLTLNSSTGSIQWQSS
ncbi:MAG: hypothetical protein CFE24_14000, partial [Flavobacterium sp. BFFFF2]